MGELVVALRANDPGAFRQWLSGGVQDLDESSGSTVAGLTLFVPHNRKAGQADGLASGREPLTIA